MLMLVIVVWVLMRVLVMRMLVVWVGVSLVMMVVVMMALDVTLNKHLRAGLMMQRHSLNSLTVTVAAVAAAWHN